MEIKSLKIGESKIVARYTIDDVIKEIEKNETDFQNDDGMFDRQYITERFSLTKEQYQKVMKALGA